MRRFLIDLILILIPVMIYALTHIFVTIETSKADIKTLEKLYESTIKRIDRRLDRIENRI
jgi:hypothetical protein